MGVTPPPWTGPAVGLMDLDAFFASVEMLDHPEWRGRAGEGVALVLGADERVHLQRRIGRRRQRGHARQQAGHRQHSPDACLFPHRPPRFEGMRTLAGSPASSTRC